jgi:UDP-N-acetylglucosamine diphosphorylase/glucosamine-1-phosphate N-acetyltransferase
MPTHHYVLFDGKERDNLLPLTATRAVASIRIGILTIKEKWEKHLGTQVDILTQDYLQPKYTLHQKENTLFINACVLPSAALCREIESLEENNLLLHEETIIAIKTSQRIDSVDSMYEPYDGYPLKFSTAEVQKIEFPWTIFTLNGLEIKRDIQLLGLKPNPEKLAASNQLIGTEFYVEDGAVCECAVLNSNDGPVYLGKDSEVMEGCTVRGPFALGSHATLKMQSKIYGDTSIGPYCKVGGEVSNSVLFGYSNKAHDGFLGNSVIGEWCNLGADTNNSNLKNNYGTIKVWNYPSKTFIPTALQFCGLIMGDHAKSGINTMFNTGTVAGVCANIFGGGFHPKFIPDFSWGQEGTFQLDKAYEVAQRVMERRGITLAQTDKDILNYIFEHTEEFRK